MVKRGPRLRPQASEGEAQHGPFAVRLVDLRLQHRLHVPRLDTDHRQARYLAGKFYAVTHVPHWPRGREIVNRATMSGLTCQRSLSAIWQVVVSRIAEKWRILAPRGGFEPPTRVPTPMVTRW